MAVAALRSIGRARGLALGIGATLALGVCAVTLIFGVVNAALFRQPPFADAGRLALLFIQRNEMGEAPQRERWSFARFQRLRGEQKSFVDVATWAPSSFTLSGGADAEPVNGERVSAAYLSLLGGQAASGRFFSEAEDDPGRPTPVVVLGDGLWRRRFGGDANVIGRTVRLNGVPLTVVGVLPRGFSGLSGKAELWIPATMAPQLTYAEYLTTNQNFISAFGRLRPGVDLEAAHSELAVLGASINRAIPSDPDHPDEKVTASAVTLNEARVDKTVRRSLFVLLGATALLHLLACANVMNLLLGRAAARRRDSAVRMALGSSGGRLFSHLFGEAFVLALVSGVAGLALSPLVSAVISPPANLWAPRNFYGSLAPFDTPSFGGLEMAFGLGLALLTALLVALPPALSAFRIDVSSGIRAGSRGIMGGGLSLRRPSPRGVIVGLEAALAMLLVVAAGLLVDSFERMRRADLGVNASSILTFWVIPSDARVPTDHAPAFVTRLLEAVTRVPGVRSATVDGGGPVSGTASSTLYVMGRPAPSPGQAPPVLRHYIGPDHFSTMGISVLRGRVFTSMDTATTPRVTVISETAARRFWPNQDPIGQRVWFGGGSTFDAPERSAEIVGVVSDVVYAPLDRQPNRASFYTPYTQFTYPSRMVFVRTAGDPLAVVSGLRRAVASVDPELAMRDVQPLTDVVSGSWARHRFDAFLFAGFGVLALLLAASGIFAVLSYAVQTRTREFGVRIALGADAARVLRDVLLEGMAFPIAGLAFGALLSLFVTRLLQSTLYEVSPQEPRVFIGTAVLLLVTAVAACVVPAWRATRTDPMEALRAE
ncbi:MAG: ABC transporter permease [Vicinamibacteria bacterium]